MAGQASLFDDEPAIEEKYFYAVFPPADVIPAIQALQRRLSGVYRCPPPQAHDRLHMTVCHVGDRLGEDKALEAKARQAASMLVAKPFRVTFDRVLNFGAQVVLAGGEGIEEMVRFQRRLHVHMAQAGLARSAKAYTPHVTLFYGSSARVEEEKVEPISWVVNELVLVRSPQGLTQHHRLASWPLKG